MWLLVQYPLILTITGVLERWINTHKQLCIFTFIFIFSTVFGNFTFLEMHKESCTSSPAAFLIYSQWEMPHICFLIASSQTAQRYLIQWGEKANLYA